MSGRRRAAGGAEKLRGARGAARRTARSPPATLKMQFVPPYASPVRPTAPSPSARPIGPGPPPLGIDEASREMASLTRSIVERSSSRRSEHGESDHVETT